MKKLTAWLRKRVVLIVVMMAAVLLEMILAVQYHSAKELLEQELEKSTFKELGASALRIQVVLTKAEVAAGCQLWHVSRHLDDPDYMVGLVTNMVSDERDNVIGAGLGFAPYYFPSKGRLYEPYAYQTEDTIIVGQIGSDKHDYTQNTAFKAAMRGDTTKWTSSYMDTYGSHFSITTYGLPIFDANGKPVGMLGVDLGTDWIGEAVNVHHYHPSSFSLVITGAGELIAGPADSVASESLVRKIVDMVNDSTVARELKANGRVTGFPFTDDEGKKGHVYYATMKREPRWQMIVVCFDDEVFGQLVQMRRDMFWLVMAALVVLGLIVQLFVRSYRRLRNTEMEQERIGSELRIAQDIQKQMLPRENSVVRIDVHVSGSQVPAREVGGDLYDFFLRDEKLFFCIGDVSGKGVPSAMLMAVIHSLFRSASAHESNPARIMQTINETSCEGNESNMFVTLFIGVLDLPTGRLRYCSAGHDVPIVISRGNVPTPLSLKPNLPVGVFDDAKYVMYEQTLPAGATLFLYTDGLTEARNSEHKLLGLDAVMQQAGEAAASDDEMALQPQHLLQRMTGAVRQFVEDAEQSDDLTMLAIRYTPEVEKDVLCESLILKNDARQIGQLSDFMKEVLSKMHTDAKLASKIRLAVEEAVVNVMDYAYPAGTAGTVTIEARSNGLRMKFTISDSGIPFDPTKALEADTDVAVEDRPIGGLGIYLVRQLMDSINYERTDGKNILTLRKKLNN